MIKYVPILRGKPGEFTALQNLDGKALNEICPLIQFYPDSNPKRVGNYLDKLTLELTNAWNFEGNLLYFDTYFLKDTHFISELIRKLEESEINFIPVIHPDSIQEYLDLIQDRNSNGYCLRIKTPNYRPEDLLKAIDTTLREYDLEESEIDLLIDLQYIDNEGYLAHYKKTFFRFFNSLTRPKRYRRIILSAGSFPVDINRFKVNRISRIPRIEDSLWNVLKHDLVDTNIIYGDYGSIHPLYNPLSKAYEASCSIKYTSDTEFYIFRGMRASKVKEGSEQYHRKSKELISCPVYDGKDFSWGDEQIYKCANREITSGNAGTWVKYTLNHHLMKILDLLD
jgi:hypothetical protein